MQRYLFSFYSFIYEYLIFRIDYSIVMNFFKFRLKFLSQTSRQSSINIIITERRRAHTSLAIATLTVCVPEWEVPAGSGSFCLLIWVIVNKTSQMGMLIRRWCNFPFGFNFLVGVCLPVFDFLLKFLCLFL